MRIYPQSRELVFIGTRGRLHGTVRSLIRSRQIISTTRKVVSDPLNYFIQNTAWDAVTCPLADEFLKWRVKPVLLSAAQSLRSDTDHWWRFWVTPWQSTRNFSLVLIQKIQLIRLHQLHNTTVSIDQSKGNNFNSTVVQLEFRLDSVSFLCHACTA